MFSKTGVWSVQIRTLLSANGQPPGALTVRGVRSLFFLFLCVVFLGVRGTAGTTSHGPSAIPSARGFELSDKGERCSGPRKMRLSEILTLFTRLGLGLENGTQTDRSGLPGSRAANLGGSAGSPHPTAQRVQERRGRRRGTRVQCVALLPPALGQRGRSLVSRRRVLQRSLNPVPKRSSPADARRVSGGLSLVLRSHRGPLRKSCVEATGRALRLRGHPRPMCSAAGRTELSALVPSFSHLRPLYPGFLS